MDLFSCRLSQVLQLARFEDGQLLIALPPAFVVALSPRHPAGPKVYTSNKLQSSWGSSEVEPKWQAIGHRFGLWFWGFQSWFDTAWLRRSRCWCLGPLHPLCHGLGATLAAAGELCQLRAVWGRRSIGSCAKCRRHRCEVDFDQFSYAFCCSKWQSWT